MRRILFLLGDSEKAHNDNHSRLPAAFSEAGWQVICESHEDIAIVSNEVVVKDHKPLDFDLIWPLGFGRQVSFFDRMQILRALPAVRFVVSVDALTYLHGKHRWLEHMPETHTSSDPKVLARQIRRGGSWILKPTAGSYGRDVVMVKEAEAGLRQLADLSARYPGSYLMLQRFLPEIAAGETRTLVAGGSLIGSYLRVPHGDFRANVALSADTRIATLPDTACNMVMEIAAELKAFGAGFAAIDTVGSKLMEVNVANPGGLATLADLGQPDLAAAVARSIIEWRGC